MTTPTQMHCHFSSMVRRLHEKPLLDVSLSPTRLSEEQLVLQFLQFPVKVISMVTLLTPFQAVVKSGMSC